MKLQICGILDSAVGAYGAPLFFRTKQEAMRAFSMGVRSADSQWAKSPADYTLMFLGEFDDNSAEFFPVEAPIRLLSATEALVD